MPPRRRTGERARPRKALEALEALRSISRSFGARAAGEKLRRLDELGRARLSPRQVRSLREVLDFVRAYPDDARVLRRVRERIDALPPAEPLVHPFAWGVVQRLVRLLPGRVEIEWSELGDEAPLSDALARLVTPGEWMGLEDTELWFTDWFGRCRPASARTDLEFLVALLEGSGLPRAMQSLLFDDCGLPIRCEGPAPCELELRPRRVHWQRRAIERGRFPIEPLIRRPLPPPERAGQALIDLALEALCARGLEIFP